MSAEMWDRLRPLIDPTLVEKKAAEELLQEEAEQAAYEKRIATFSLEDAETLVFNARTHMDLLFKAAQENFTPYLLAPEKAFEEDSITDVNHKEIGIVQTLRWGNKLSPTPEEEEFELKSVTGDIKWHKRLLTPTIILADFKSVEASITPFYVEIIGDEFTTLRTEELQSNPDLIIEPFSQALIKPRQNIRKLDRWGKYSYS